jgi:hypothetical protein
LLQESKKAELIIVANYNPNLAKINRSYTIEELAAVYGVHKNTIAGWVKNGLPCLKERRPFLILGLEARAYLKYARASKKQKCKPDEFYCMRCRAPTKPGENLVEYIPLSAVKGRLSGSCEHCECIVNKFVGYESLKGYRKIFDISISRAWEHLNDSDKPLLNSDSKR